MKTTQKVVTVPLFKQAQEYFHPPPNCRIFKSHSEGTIREFSMEPFQSSQGICQR
jgi:hypothetical protein